MFITRVNGWNPANRLRNEMEQLVSNMLGPGAMGFPETRVFPAVNVWEDEKNLYAEAEVPGIRFEEIEVFVQGNDLTIKGERKDAANSEKQTSYHRRERGAGAFSRTVSLPVSVNAGKVSAALRDGVLLVTLPKADEVLPRRIQVNG